MLRRSTIYARHFTARSVRNARQGNIYLLLAFFGSLVVLLRALSGIGYDENDYVTQTHPSALHKLRLRSQQGIEMGWERLGKPGLGIWQDVVRREHALEDNWFYPAIHALQHEAALVIRAVEDELGNTANEETMTNDEDDEELLAPSHTYHRKVVTLAGGVVDSK